MKNVTVRLGGRRYEIYVGAGLLEHAGTMLRECRVRGRVVVITDSRVRPIYGPTLEKSLAAAELQTAVIELPEGEQQKSLDTAGRVCEELTNLNAERNTPILALGGGVIGDLAGFVAATYLRGVPLVQIPTTLLAQVDSSIGGKVAVNHGRLKNRIGAFYQPRMVISDIATLRTLPAGEISDGLAEVIKYGVILDAPLFGFVARRLNRIKALDTTALEHVVYRCARIKAQVVAQDELDQFLRNILNYGHTVGHAVETASGFAVRHGEAVAVGMVAAGRIALRMGAFTADEARRIEGLLVRAGLPVNLPPYPVDQLMDIMKHDKKMRQGKLVFILPRAIGDVFVSEEVDPSLVASVLGDMR